MPVKKLNINSDNENRRLDNYLMNRLKNIPKTNNGRQVKRPYTSELWPSPLTWWECFDTT